MSPGANHSCIKVGVVQALYTLSTGAWKVRLMTNRVSASFISASHPSSLIISASLSSRSDQKRS